MTRLYKDNQIYQLFELYMIISESIRRTPEICFKQLVEVDESGEETMKQ